MPALALCLYPIVTPFLKGPNGVSRARISRDTITHSEKVIQPYPRSSSSCENQYTVQFFRHRLLTPNDIVLDELAER